MSETEGTDGLLMNSRIIHRETGLIFSEIFFSLQGEGPWAGLPAVFFRLGGCVEPFCPWCDTASALHCTDRITAENALGTIRDYPCSRVVITGGEPFLQWESGLSGLHHTLLAEGFEVQYETSGKVVIPRLDDAMVICSPKHVSGAWRFHEENTPRADFFKFLAGDSRQLELIDEFIAAHGIARHKVYIMALGATRPEQLARMGMVFDYCVKRGYRMTPRLHILAHDTRRGI